MTVKTVSLYTITKSIPLPTMSATKRIPMYGAARIAHGTITLGNPKEARYTVTGIAPAMLDERAEAVVDARALISALKSAPVAPILSGPTPGSLSVNGITVPGLAGLCVGDIDPMPKLILPCTIIRGEGLSALYQLAPAMGTDITRSILRGAWIDGADCGPLTAWASDGHRAHGIPMPEGSVEGVVPRRSTIPSRGLAVAKACKATSIGLGETRTGAGAGYAGIEIHVPGGAIIRSQGPERGVQSPDMSQLIPADAAKGAMPVPITLATQLKTLQTAVKVAGHPGAAAMLNASGAVCLLTSEGYDPAPADIRASAILKWHRENPGVELFRADVPTCGEAAGDVAVRANPAYLVDAINFVGSGVDATLSTRGAGAPIMLRHADGRIALVMPVR